MKPGSTSEGPPAALSLNRGLARNAEHRRLIIGQEAVERADHGAKPGGRDAHVVDGLGLVLTHQGIVQHEFVPVLPKGCDQ